MLTRDIDAGLYAIDRCRAVLPAMLRHYGPDSRERAALTELLTTVLRASDAVAWKPSPRRPSSRRFDQAIQLSAQLSLATSA